MRGLVQSIVLGTSLACTGAQSVSADELMVPLAESGTWIAEAHRPTMLAPPDVCLALSEQGVGLRADDEGNIEFRVLNSKWSLPADVHGDIAIAVGTWNATLSIASNTDTMVSAPIDTDALLPMFAAMDKASAMNVVVGKAKPIIVSLSGSTRATNAFRTCAGIKSNGVSAGANPFE